MKLAPPPRTACYALVGCAVFLLFAFVYTNLRTTDAAARLPPTPMPSETRASLAPTKGIRPIAPPIVAGAVALPAVVTNIGGADDLARLRERGLTVPVSAVVAAQLTDNYFQPRAGGASHEALDIMAPRGTPVLAVEDGRVAKLFLSKAGGITLYQFDPGTEYVYYYAHLDRYAEGVAEGAAVLKGQVIGYVGSTGNASPDAPHLHFAVFRLGPERQWWRGTPINPFLIWRNVKP